ncbi:MAG: hypothetical protein K9K88_14720 [Desulfobacterales bacterium]|nr:hypothetical protein [Desulfobacterales bacterium]
MNTARRYNLFFPGTLNRDDSLEDLTVFIPFRLAERIEAYAKQNGADSTHVVIEAIDTFLRRSGWKERSSNFEVRNVSEIQMSE